MLTCPLNKYLILFVLEIFAECQVQVDQSSMFVLFLLLILQMLALSLNFVKEYIYIYLIYKLCTNMALTEVTCKLVVGRMSATEKSIVKCAWTSSILNLTFFYTFCVCHLYFLCDYCKHVCYKLATRIAGNSA